MAPVFNRQWIQKWRLTAVIARGSLHYWGTVGLVIPGQVASPQSLIPFHQA